MKRRKGLGENQKAINRISPVFANSIFKRYLMKMQSGHMMNLEYLMPQEEMPKTLFNFHMKPVIHINNIKNIFMYPSENIMSSLEILLIQYQREYMGLLQSDTTRKKYIAHLEQLVSQEQLLKIRKQMYKAISHQKTGYKEVDYKETNHKETDYKEIDYPEIRYQEIGYQEIASKENGYQQIKYTATVHQVLDDITRKVQENLGQNIEEYYKLHSVQSKEQLQVEITYMRYLERAIKPEILLSIRKEIALKEESHRAYIRHINKQDFRQALHKSISKVYSINLVKRMARKEILKKDILIKEGLSTKERLSEQVRKKYIIKDTQTLEAGKIKYITRLEQLVSQEELLKIRQKVYKQITHSAIGQEEQNNQEITYKDIANQEVIYSEADYEAIAQKDIEHQEVIHTQLDSIAKKLQENVKQVIKNQYNLDKVQSKKFSDEEAIYIRHLEQVKLELIEYIRKALMHEEKSHSTYAKHIYNSNLSEYIRKKYLTKMEKLLKVTQQMYKENMDQETVHEVLVYQTTKLSKDISQTIINDDSIRKLQSERKTQVERLNESIIRKNNIDLVHRIAHKEIRKTDMVIKEGMSEQVRKKYLIKGTQILEARKILRIEGNILDRNSYSQLQRSNQMRKKYIARLEQLVSYEELLKIQQKIYQSITNQEIGHKERGNQEITYRNINHQEITYKGRENQVISHKKTVHQVNTHKNITHQVSSYKNVEYQAISRKNVAHQEMVHQEIAVYEEVIYMQHLEQVIRPEILWHIRKEIVHAAKRYTAQISIMQNHTLSEHIRRKYLTKMEEQEENTYKEVVHQELAYQMANTQEAVNQIIRNHYSLEEAKNERQTQEKTLNKRISNRYSTEQIRRMANKEIFKTDTLIKKGLSEEVRKKYIIKAQQILETRKILNLESNIQGKNNYNQIQRNRHMRGKYITRLEQLVSQEEMLKIKQEIYKQKANQEIVYEKINVQDIKHQEIVYQQIEGVTIKVQETVDQIIKNQYNLQEVSSKKLGQEEIIYMQHLEKIIKPEMLQAIRKEIVQLEEQNRIHTQRMNHRSLSKSKLYNKQLVQKIGEQELLERGNTIKELLSEQVRRKYLTKVTQNIDRQEVLKQNIQYRNIGETLNENIRKVKTEKIEFLEEVALPLQYEVIQQPQASNKVEAPSLPDIEFTEVKKQVDVIKETMPMKVQLPQIKAAPPLVTEKTITQITNEVYERLSKKLRLEQIKRGL